MHKIYLTLPWAPAYGSYYCQTRRGKYVSKTGVLYRGSVATECAGQNALNLGLADSLEFSVIFYPPDRRTRDFDNHLKSLQDALTHCNVWVDDGLIDQLHVYRGSIVNGGKVLVRIAEGSMKIPMFPINSDVWEFLSEE